MTEVEATKRRKISNSDFGDNNLRSSEDSDEDYEEDHEDIYLRCEVCEGTEIPDRIRECYICTEDFCLDCIYAYDPEHFIFMSWDCLRNLFIARCKEESSVFYKDKLPFDVLKIIIWYCRMMVEEEQYICVNCEDEYDQQKNKVTTFPF